MKYSELREQTWIQLDNEYYFVKIVRDEYCQLIKSIPEDKTLKKQQFPAPNIQPVEPNKYDIGTRVLYVGEYEIFKNQLGVIQFIDHEDARLTYGILFDDAANENDELWVSAFDILPIDY
jgi:hypothetical protein